MLLLACRPERLQGQQQPAPQQLSMPGAGALAEDLFRAYLEPAAIREACQHGSGVCRVVLILTVHSAAEGTAGLDHILHVHAVCVRTVCSAAAGLCQVCDAGLYL